MICCKRTQSIRRLLLIGSKGIGQEIHARLHIVVATVADLASLAVAILSGTLSIHVLALGRDNDRPQWIKEQLNLGRGQIGSTLGTTALGHFGAHFQEFVHRLLHSTIIPSLGNRNGSIETEYIAHKELV
jgi:hypothetical protein